MDSSTRILNQSNSILRTDSFDEREPHRRTGGAWDSEHISYEPRSLRPLQSGTSGVTRSNGDQYLEQAGDFWETTGYDASTGHDALEKWWKWGVEVSSQIWEKLEPHVMDYMPEDRNPFWVCGIVVLVVFLAIAGLRLDSKQTGVLKKVDMSPTTAQFVKLYDGRHIAYREQGAIQEIARHTVLVVHGFPSSRFAGIPGIKDRLLEEFGVRLIAYDLPGFGESDLHPRRNLRTSARDMACIADALGLSEKFWVLGYSTGGIHVWAAMKYIPERLAGAALFAPAGNLYAPNMTKQEINKLWGAFKFQRRLIYRIARWVPSLLPYFCLKTLIKKVDKLESGFLDSIGKKDQALMEQQIFLEALMKDIREAVRQQNLATLAHELVMQVRPWGFHLSDLRIRRKLRGSGILQHIKGLWKKEEEEWEGFNGPIHIWQGTEDELVPITINEFALRMVPQATFHRLEGEGHFSYFCFCDHCHRKIFLTLFGDPEDGKSDVAGNPAFVVSAQ